ncbi:MAG: protein kinase [Thermoleophilia bacterium]|nr:protein kinase [Thermoleophilia bacterium]
MPPADDRTVPDIEPAPPPRLAGVAAVGESIGGYVVREHAGTGGMAVVFRAHDPRLDRDVALKLIVPEYAHDPRWRARFLEESLAIAALDHPNVVPVHQRGEDDGRLFIAMRFVDGDTLSARIRAAGGLPAAEALRITADVAAALEAAHRRGIVHGDVKPANVLLAGGDGGHVYLSDFGLVARDAAGPGVLRPLGWAGTAAYAAPELIRGGGATTATDTYALGCLLVEALTGRPPFPGDRIAALAGHLADPPPSVTERTPGLPERLDEVLRRALAKDPAERPAGPAALAAAALAARHPLVLLHRPEVAAEAGLLAVALDGDGVSAWWSDRAAGDPRGDRNAAGTAAARAVLLGSSGGGGLWEVARPAPAAVLLPGAGERAVREAEGHAARPVIDLRAALDDPDAHRRLLALAGAERAEGGGLEGCPYLGLAAFQEDDAGRFVGREDDTRTLLDLVGRAGVVAVVGDSGSGKSSLLRAGLVPAVRAEGLPDADDWDITVATPGALDPRVLTPPGDGGRLVVIDQFEEVLSPEVPPARREALLAAIAGAAAPHRPLRVVLAVRADFAPALARDPVLAAILGRWAFRVGPLSPAAVRRVAEVPAARAGLVLEAGLARRIADDVAERPGALPLLSHLLLELWRRRRGRTLTLEAYAAGGGVEGALARSANEVLAAVPEPHREVARRVLLRLVQPGEGTEDTRRRVGMDELEAAGDPDAVRAVVDAFAGARLLTLGSDAAGRSTVEVAHEALIRGWGVLRGWVDADRDRLRAERRLTTAARDWEAAERDDAHLYRGALLAEWAERGEDGLSPRERRFLAASHARREREAQRARRRRRLVLTGAAAAVAVFAGISAVALWQRSEAATERDRARAQVLVLRARDLLSTDPAAAVAVARDAVAAAPGPQSLASLRQAMSASPEAAAVRVGERELHAVAVTPGGQVVAGDAAGRVVRWDPATGAVTDVARHRGAVTAVAAGPGWSASAGEDGRLVVAVPGGGARVLPVPAAPLVLAVTRDGGRLAVAGGPAVPVYGTRGWRVLARVPVAGASAVAFTRTGDLAVAAGARVEVRDTESGAVRDATDIPDGTVVGIGARPDGSLMLASEAGTVWSWSPGAPPAREAAGSQDLPMVAPGGNADLTNDAARDAVLVIPRLGPPARLPQSGETRAAVLAGGRAVTAHNDGTLRVWDLGGLPRVVATVPEGGAAGAFDAAGDVTAVVASGRAWLRALAGGPVRVAPFRGAVAADVSADGTTIAVAIPGAVGVWRPGRPPLRVPVDDLYAAGLTDDGRRLAVVDGGRLTIRDTATGRRVGRPPAGPDPVGSVRYLPGSDELVITRFREDASSVVRVQRYDPSTGAVTPLFGPTGWAAQIDVSPAGRTVAVASETAKSVTVWTAGGTARVVASTGSPARSVAVSPDGRLVAAGTVDGLVGVWSADGDWAIPAAIRAGRPVVAVRVTDAGRVTASFEDGTVRRWRCGACALDPRLLSDADTRIARDPVAAARAAGLIPD